MVTRLTSEEKQAALADSSWSLLDDRDAITRTFTFSDFVEAFGFMSQVALLAEKADHHPEWTNIYSTVMITLSTHEADGVTQRDIDLATAIDALT